MGTPLPPNPDGDLCTRCWGDGKTFGNIPTPQFVKAKLSNLQQGDFWDQELETLLLSDHVLEQDGAPCRFRVDDGSFRWSWICREALATCEVIDLASGKIVLTNGGESLCAIILPDDGTTPANRFAHSGDLTISFF